MRMVITGLVSLLLSLAVLVGTWGPQWANPPLWVALAIAAVVGLVAGALMLRRMPSWLAWGILVLFTWVFYALAAIYKMPAPQVAAFVVYPLSASAGGLVGLILRRAQFKSSLWRAAPVALCALVVAGLVLLHAPLLVWGNPGSYPAPAFVLKRANGETVSAQALRGKTVVLAFWATWCGPCREELPALNALYWQHYANSKDVRFFLVDEDQGQEAGTKATAWLAAHKVTMPSVLDPDGAVQKGFKTYGVVPTRIVISPSHQVSLTQLGYSGGHADFSKLRKAIAELSPP